jgi:pimeloyl-ACP methyl ester carboxylesterase
MRYYLFILASVLALHTLAFADSAAKYNKELDDFSYPFDVKTFSFNSQSQDLKMRYMDIGDKDAPKVIVLLHGKNFSAYYWEKNAKDLIKRNYRVIMPDQIGFGKSSKPDCYQYSSGQLGLNTKLVLDNLNIKKFDLVGYSMGGMLAVTFAANYSALANKLILINPIELEDYSKYVEFKDVNFFYELELGSTLEKSISYQKK